MRLSHRVPRDQRVSTHLALAARALGATKMFYTGTRDIEFEDVIDRIIKNWGGKFRLEYVENPMDIINKARSMNYVIVHLTMYGIPLNQIIDELLRMEKFLIIVGSEKTPIKYFNISDFNIAVGSQPHSEISALAIFLDRIFQGIELEKIFPGGVFAIINSERGKYLINDFK